MRPSEDTASGNVGADVAGAIKDHFMSLKLKTARGEACEVGETAADFEYTVACTATEVMMMALPSDFVSLRLAGEFD